MYNTFFYLFLAHSQRFAPKYEFIASPVGQCPWKMILVKGRCVNPPPGKLVIDEGPCTIPRPDGTYSCYHSFCKLLQFLKHNFKRDCFRRCRV